MGGSYTARVCAAVVQYNTNGHAGSRFHEFFGIVPNNYCLKIENERKGHYLENEIARQAKPRKRAVKDKAVKGYKVQKEDLSERSLEVAMNIELDKLEINRLNRDTILRDTYGQKLNQKWKEIRKKVINCNYFARIINARGPRSYQKILEEMLYSPVELGNTAEVRHQRLYEQEALKKFSRIHTIYKLKRTGIFIDKDLSYLGIAVDEISGKKLILRFSDLGASPLRLYGPDSIVTVQCPVKAFRKTVDEAIQKKLLPLTYKDGDVHIKEKSSWYIDVQAQLRITGTFGGKSFHSKLHNQSTTGRNVCYFIVWLEKEFVIKRVDIDPSFWNSELLQKLEYFFKEAMLKELADPRRGRKMELRKYEPTTKKFV